jgi:penicillin-binding protein 2
MVNYPTYDINKFVSGINLKDWNELNNSSLKPMYNRAISATYSPGSTYKMLVGLAGLSSGKITVDEKINDPGIYPLGHKPKCWIYEMYKITHGNINLSEAIKVSCNCYFYEVGNRIGIEKIVEFSKLFGLGSKTGIEIPGEVKGNIAGDSNNKFYLGDLLSASIGQSYNSYTPIQLANYISAIANGGTLNKVSVVKSVQDQNTEVSLDDVTKTATNVTGVSFNKTNLNIPKEHLDAIKKGMYDVANDRGGTSYSIFKNSGIEVAGKTGTAQVANGSNDGIFVGFAPYNNPRIAVFAVIEHGGEGTYTANVVKPIMEEYFKISKQDNLNIKEQNISDVKIVF